MSDVLNIVNKAKAGDDKAMETLFRLFRPKITSICRKYFLVGADFDDLIQEGMIGLFKAINAFDPTKNNLSTFASLCIHRQLQNAVKNANRKKNSPLNSYIPINFEDSDEDESTSNLVLVDDNSDVEKNFIDKELNAVVISKVKDLLTDEQFKLLKMFLKGDSYSHIAKTLNISVKKVDNLVQAIKKKLRTIKGEI